MLVKRVIACLDIEAGRVVKGRRFREMVDAGDPVSAARRYCENGADEIVVLDISASIEARLASLHVIGEIARAIDIPLTAGGGVRIAGDVALLLNAGADKVSINSAALARPGLLSECAARFGSQCVVLAIDARRDGDRYTVASHGARMPVRRDPLEWAREGEQRGAGELLVTSIDRDGTGEGFDLRLLAALASSATIPVIASGGAIDAGSFVDAFACGADAALGASAFHFGRLTIGEVKSRCAAAGFEVRP